MWTQLSNPRRSYCDFNIWSNDLERRVTCWARLCDIFHQVWRSTTYQCLNYSVLCWYVMSRCDHDLWPIDLECSWFTCSKSARNLSEIEQSPVELLIILRIFAHVMSRCDLDLWPLDLELLRNFGWYVYKLCAKFERNRIITAELLTRRFSTFRHAILGVGALLPNGSQRCVDPTSPNVADAQGDHSYTRYLFQRSDILLHFQTLAAQSWVMLKTTPNFAVLDPPPGKIRGGMGEISILIVEALPTTEPPKYIWWPSTARLLNTVDW